MLSGRRGDKHLFVRIGSGENRFFAPLRMTCRKIILKKQDFTALQYRQQTGSLSGSHSSLVSAFQRRILKLKLLSSA